MRFTHSNGRKPTLEWPKVVSEVSFPRFWGVLSIAKGFLFSFRWSEVLFYVKLRESRYLGNGTFDHRNEKTYKHLQSTPQNLRKLTSETTFGHSKVVFRPLLRTKRAFSQNPLMARFWIFFWWYNFFLKKFNQFLGHLALFYFWGVVKDCCVF